VHGNWEAWYWGDLPLLAGTGFRWLHDRRTSIEIKGQTLHLVGLPYRDDATGAAAERLLSRIRGPGWRILLYHTPDLAEEVPSADLYLAGHTHGGQIALPFYGALVTLSRHGKRYERGLRRNGNTLVYVNPGIGVEPMVPLRIGVRPEVTLLTLGARPGSGS
jgi:predicted MPP superfamily phosphohydrolase